MRSSSASQTITNNVAGTGSAINFATLQFGRNGNKTIGATAATNISASTLLALGYSGSALGGNFDLSTNTLTIADATSYSASGTPTLTFSNGTVNYTRATAGQSIFSRSGGVTYGNLGTSGNSKVAAEAITVTGTFTNSVTTDFGTYAFTGTSATYANTGTLRSQGSVTLGTGTSVNGTFEYYLNSGSQTVANATYAGTLNLTGNATKSVGDVVLGDVYTASGGARTYTGTVEYNKAGTQSILADAYSNLTLNGSNTKSFSGTTSISGTLNASNTSVNVTIASGTTTLGSSSTLGGNLVVDGILDADVASSTTTFNGDAQAISTTGSGSITGFSNLTLSGTAAKTSSLSLTVNNTFTPNRGITMSGSSLLDITNSAAAAVAGYSSQEEVAGSMRRAVTTTGTYTMNNSATTVAFTTLAPTTFTLGVSPATPPTGYAGATHVNRQVIYNYSGAWATGTADLKLGYTLSEAPSANESKLRFFEGSALAANKIATGSAIGYVGSGAGSFGTLDLAGIRPDGAGSGILVAQIIPGSEIVMSNIATPYITTANTQDFNTVGTWDEGVVPTLSDDAQISHTGITVSGAVQVAALTIDANKDLTVSGANLTAASVNNAGTLAVSDLRTLAVSGAFANSGVFNVNGIANIATGSGLTVTSSGNITVGTTGALAVGTVTTALSNLTMSGASVLTVNGDGPGVGADGAVTVYGDLTISSSAGSPLVNNGVITVGQ